MKFAPHFTGQAEPKRQKFYKRRGAENAENLKGIYKLCMKTKYQGR